MLRIVEASGAKEFAQAAELLSAFPTHQRMRYASDIEIVERYFDDDDYAREMAGLQSIYSATGGSVLLAREGETAVGAVCLKKLDATYCEMKRLFVPIEHRRKGIGGMLSDALLRCARNRGFKYMRLDTGTFMIESHALYEKMGFEKIEPYYEVTGRLRDGLYFMELEL